MRASRVHPILPSRPTANLTFDSTGLEGWSHEDFARAVRDGLAPDGSPIRWPMPRFRAADEVDLRAIYEYLRSRPPTRHEVPGSRPRQAATARGQEELALGLEDGRPNTFFRQ